MKPHPIHELVTAPIGGFPERQVRAHFTEESAIVYQAFSPEIGVPAVRAQRFVNPFRRNRMTWIKPSFAWMMYRSGWATKVGQECVLRIQVARAGFEWALSNSCLSVFSSARHLDHHSWRRSLKEKPVRIQWDPERTLLMEALPWRTIQIGIGQEAVDRYVDEWVLGIEDVTETVRIVHSAVQVRDFPTVDALVPSETPYPLLDSIAKQVDAEVGDAGPGPQGV